jgi:zinc protease
MASAFIGDYEEGLSGSSSKKDLETMFQLIHLRFTQPRADPTAFTVMQGTMKSSIPLQRANPGFLFSEALTTLLSGNHPRRRLPSLEMVEAMNLEKSVAFYKDRFADAGDFTFVFVGNFDPADLKPLVERYLGSLPSSGRKESWKDVGIRFARGVAERRVEKGVEPKSQAAIVFTGDFQYTQDERIAISALGEVLQTRLHETLREDLGGTYGVSARPNYLRIPAPEYTMSISFSCAPERTEELVKAVFAQVELLKAEGPTDKQVNDTREKLLRDYETNQKQNGYWVCQLLMRHQMGEPVDSLFGLTEYYKKLTPALIQDAAKRYLNPANHVKVTLFPEKKGS